MATSNTYFYALGSRKSATARVRVQSGKGNIVVNGQPASEYFASSSYLLNRLVQPFVALDLEGKHDVSVVVSGGGHKGQIEAISLGIAKALVVMTPELKSTLKRADLISRDPRERERKKFGLKGARKQRQFTKR
ncbi:MAG: 30S ribosomal protein S9 [Candidatus Saccharimonadales bacterium]